MKRPRPEQLACIVIVLLIMGTGLWLVVARKQFIRAYASLPVHPAAAYARQTPAAESLSVGAVWTPPKAQSRGDAWVYEVFTPPEIFCDAHTRQFRITPAPLVSERPEKNGDEFGLKVISIEPQPFPLQLVGYVGETGKYFGTFENRATSETLLLKAGDQVPSLGLTVESVEVRPVPVAIPESMTVREDQVSAVVTARESGRRTTLQQGVTSMTDQLSAQVILMDEPGPGRAVVEGTTVARGDGTRFVIGKIRLAPPSVEVIKEAVLSGASTRETQTLSPEGGATVP